MQSKSTKQLILIICLFILISISLKAQFKDYTIKYGIQFNGLVPANEFNDYENGLKTSYLGRIFLKHELGKFLEGEFGAGYGQHAGLDLNRTYYKSVIIPVDYRLVLSPFNLTSWNPYIYAGIGLLYYENKFTPSVISPYSVKKNGWNGIVPLGIGSEIDLGGSVLLDISAGAGLSFTDDLNYYKKGDPFDAHYSLGFGFTGVSNAGNSDNDEDGLTKSEEKALGTNPDIKDSDGDRLNDGEEAHKYLTNPLKTDSDNDGLSDGDEVEIFSTNPNKPDSDGDKLSDNDELMNFKTDPNKTDTDGDGLSDFVEINNYKTDPNRIDTDADGLSDADEINKYRTDPNNKDTDIDGLSDSDEVMKYKTDPLKNDTDGGSISDGREVARGTDPLNADDDVVKIKAPIVLEGIVFTVNSAKISPESEQTLQKALKILKTNPDISVEIRGYTDNTGSRSYNVKLSQKRAESVMNWLINNGTESDRITALGMGPDNPIAPNDTPEGRMKNRRIEFIRLK